MHIPPAPHLGCSPSRSLWPPIPPGTWWISQYEAGRPRRWRRCSRARCCPGDRGICGRKAGETYGKPGKHMRKHRKTWWRYWKTYGKYGKIWEHINGTNMGSYWKHGIWGTKMMDTNGETIYGKTHWQNLWGKYGNTHRHKQEPIWKIWLRQLGWWHSQYYGKIKHVPNHQPDMMETHTYTNEKMGM